MKGKVQREVQDDAIDSPVLRRMMMLVAATGSLQRHQGHASG